MDRKTFVHCPYPNCDEPITGSWNELLTGTFSESGRPEYMCPNCKRTFTSDDVKVNAIPVPDNGEDVFLFDTIQNRVILRVTNDMKFTDGEATYVHIPHILASKNNIKCYCFVAPMDMSDKEIQEECIRFHNRTKELNFR